MSKAPIKKALKNFGLTEKEAEIYIFLEPTAGVDVGAKTGIYNLIRQLSKGAAVILISSDCEEVAGVCDRVMTMFKGKVTMDEDVSCVSPEEILLCGVKERATNGRNDS